MYIYTDNYASSTADKSATKQHIAQCLREYIPVDTHAVSTGNPARTYEHNKYPMKANNIWVPSTLSVLDAYYTELLAVNLRRTGNEYQHCLSEDLCRQC
jgi:hypothetical protein